MLKLLASLEKGNKDQPLEDNMPLITYLGDMLGKYQGNCNLVEEERIMEGTYLLRVQGELVPIISSFSFIKH